MDKQDQARFWGKVRKASNTECWHWTAHSHERGYGVFWLGKKSIRANRLALILTSGPPPFDGAMALHSCDTPSCCNPAHLRWGTAQDNVDDKILRRGPARGENAPRSTITADQVDLIYRRRLEGYTITEIADEIGAPYTTVENVYTGNAWSHRLGIGDNPTLEQLRAKRTKRTRRPSHNRVVTDKLAARIYALRMSGVAIGEIAKRLNLPLGTVSPVACGLAFQHLLGVNGNPTFAELRAARAEHPGVKLTEEDLQEIKSLLGKGFTGASVARKYGVSTATVSNIRSGKRG